MANSNAPTKAESNSTTHDKNSSSSDAFTGDSSQLAFLQEIISSPGPAGEDVAESDISALLKQLETADGVAQGVESKLDKLLENLEGLLDGLEGAREVRAESRTNESDLNNSPGPT